MNSEQTIPVYKTIIISDVHLGIKSSKAKELVRFLKAHPCKKLILNGDIIDGWQLRKSGRWRRKHTRLFKIVMQMLERTDTRVVYIRGNHDDFLDEILPISMGNFSIVRDHIHISGDKRYYVCHGDVFDNVTTHFRFIARLGDVGYTFLLWLNRMYNNRRVRRGLPYYSLSQVVKNKVKQAVSYINKFESELVYLAKAKKFDGIICGHIHHPSNRFVDGIHYMNSGDWVETMSALTEDFGGNWQIQYYTEWVKNTEALHPASGYPLNIDYPVDCSALVIPELE